MSLQAEFLPWAEGQHNNNGWKGQYCVEIGNTMYEAGKWSRMDCSLPTKFICEKSAGGLGGGKF